MKRADSLLTPFIRELGIEDGVKLAEIRRNWYNLFDKPLSYHMSPFILSKGEILLNVDSPVWLQELTFYKEDIIKKMSSYGVKTVRFRLGRVSIKVKSGIQGQKSRVEQLTTEELSYIEETVSKINDEKLKETVQKAMKKSFATGMGK